MLRINDVEIRTVRHPSEWAASAHKPWYFEPSSEAEYKTLKHWLADLENGELIFVRGRDILCNGDDTLAFDAWCYGLAVKTDRDSLFLLWQDNVERFEIREINLFEQLHFQCKTMQNHCLETCYPAENNITMLPAVVLSHGFCPSSGPDYPLINTISILLRSVGHHVIVPDFRSSYMFGSGRARSERVRVIIEELLDISCQNSRKRNNPGIILIGHSQGGAAVAQTCASTKVVESANIKGLILLGSESPVEAVRSEDLMQMALLDGHPPPEPATITHSDRPTAVAPEDMLFIHSSQDRVIHYTQIEQLANNWGGVKFAKLNCDAVPEHPSVPWADDLQHDFLTYHLLTSVIDSIFVMLNK